MNSGRVLYFFSYQLCSVYLCRCRPERWESLPETVQEIPSVYGHLLTFTAGPHSCIGYRFSVAECVNCLLYACLFPIVDLSFS
jgi:hypothetical protein